MPALRRLVHGHRRLAGLLLLVALAMKLAMPGGYMAARDHGRVAIALCSGAGAARSVTMAMPGLDAAAPHHRVPESHGKGETPCAFSVLAAQATGPGDPFLLADAIAFAFQTAQLPTAAIALPRTGWLRPPLRAPPRNAPTPSHA